MADTMTVRLRTTGMHCQSCSMLIQMSVEDLPGVESVASDFRTGVTEVSYDPDQLAVEDIVTTIVTAGYGAELQE